MKAPTLDLERECWSAGDDLVCGVDEVGRGAWAGPLTVGVAVAPKDRGIDKVRDSKQLSASARERLFEGVKDWAIGQAVGHASHEECDALGMTAALRLAGNRALEALHAQGCRPDRVLLDGSHNYLGLGDRVRTVVKGDQSSLSIAAASIIAKVTRDRIMAEEAQHYPAYDFDSNRGYPSPRHRFALHGYGATVIHRRSWAFMDDLIWGGRLVAQRSLF